MTAQPAHGWLRQRLPYLYLLRVPGLGLVALVVLLPALGLGLGGLTTITNLMVVTTLGHQLLTGTLAVISVGAGVFTAAMILSHGPERMPEVDRIFAPQITLSRRGQIIVLALSAPLFVAMGYETITRSGLSAWRVLPGLAGGAVIGALVLLGIDRVRAAVVAPAVDRSPAARTFFRWLGPGFSDAGGPLPGHALAAAATLVFLTIYTAGFWLFQPRGVFQLPALGYVLLLVTTLVSLLTGVTFFFDRFRVPLLLPLGLWIAAVQLVNPSDHFFPVMPDSNPSPLPMERAFEARLARQTAALAGAKSPVITVVTASGGGIQAAAWTARVLTGLRRAAGDEFANSLHFVTGASGGAVGLLYYLEGIDRTSGLPPDSLLERIDEAASASSLEAMAWGVVYPDFLRLFLPFRFESDRGRAIEEEWDKTVIKLKGGAASRMSAWRADVARGVLPTPVFNATVVESGVRLLLSPVTLDAAGIHRHSGTAIELFGGRAPLDLSVTTAARLSATFPYATPVATPSMAPVSADTLASWHVADGGYFDNYGTVVGIEWLKRLLEGNLVPGRVLWLNIRAFPRDSVGPEKKPSVVFAAGAPIRTMLAVRNSSQIGRGDLELQILCAAWPGRIDRITAEFTGQNAPLSWYLSRRDISSIDSAWRRIEGAAAAALRKVLDGEGEARC